MTLEFEITNQFINRVDTLKPVAKSQNYLYAHFTFLTEEWQNQAVTAIFTRDDASYEVLLNTEGVGLVPWEVMQDGGDIHVSCFCDGLVTVNKSRVHIYDTGYIEEGENTQEPTPNIYDQLTSQFNALRLDVEERFKVIDGGNFTDW